MIGWILGGLVPDPSRDDEHVPRLIQIEYPATLHVSTLALNIPVMYVKN